MPNHRGFSIIELVIGMAILAVLLAAAAPSFTSWIQNAQIRTAADSIHNGIQIARMEAIRLNKQVRFVLTDAAGKSDWRICTPVSGTNAANPCTVSTDIQSRSSNEGSANVGVGADTAVGALGTPLNVADGMPAYVTFDPFGRVPSSPGGDSVRFDVRNKSLPASAERVLTILISAGGQIRFCDPKLSLATNPQGCA